MFTGIVTHTGTVRRMRKANGGARVEIEAGLGGLSAGASVACAGVCLTVTEAGEDWFAADVSSETLARTTLGSWDAGTAVNLERPLRAGDEIGGHFVLGHVDGVAEVEGRREDGDSVRLHVAAPDGLAALLAPKGSVALDGVSLTVNEVDGARFGVDIIPHTLAGTTLGAAVPGTRLNLEADPLARYAARLLQR